MENLSAISAFVFAAEQRSYVAAARVAGLSPSAISKAVSRLEERLHVRLLNRTTRSLSLTEEGAALYERCRRILDELEDVQASLTDIRDHPQGRLKISTPHIVFHHLLMPVLPSFVRSYPDVELDIDISDHVVDLTTERIDVCIRSGELQDSSMTSRRLGGQHFVVCGSPDYFNCNPPPLSPADLTQHSCIHFRYPSSGRLAPWSFSAPFERLLPPRTITFNNTDAGLRAAISGLGLAHLPVYVAAPSLKSGALLPSLMSFMAPFGALSLLWSSHRRLAPKARVFVDFVIENLTSQREAFQPALVLFRGETSPDSP